MERHGPGPDRENFGEADLGEAQSANPPDDPEMIALSGFEEADGVRAPSSTWIVAAHAPS